MPQMSGRYDQALVIRREPSAGWAKAMMREIHEALLFNGIESVLFDIDAPGAAEVIAAMARRPFYVVDCNHRPAINARVPRFSVMVDHPCMRLSDLALAKPGLEVLGWVDESHLAAAAALGIPLPSHFLPHAGPDPVDAPSRMTRRDIDIFFAGGLAEPVGRAEWRVAHPEAPPIVCDLIFDTVELIRRELEPALPAFLSVCRHHGVDAAGIFSRDDFCVLITEIIDIAEMNCRHDILTALPEVRVVVASSYLPKALRDRAQLRWLGQVDDFAEIRRLMGRSKVVLNTTSKFPAGSHERIWFAMAEGAVALTDPSSFLAGDFTEGREILYLPKAKRRDGLA
jgi:hypothetical protein